MGILGDWPQQPQRYGLLSPDVMRLIQSGGPRAPAPAPAAPAAPRRERVSGWRVFDRVLGGQTVTEGLDAERARLEMEAARPQMEAQRQQILGSIQDPRERALFLASPEDWAKNVGQQFAPQVIAAGSGQAIGGRLGVEMPTYTESGDQILRRTSQGIEPAYTRTDPSISERIAQQNADSTRMTAERPIELAPGAVALNPDGSSFGQGAPRVFSAPDATQLFTEDGRMLAENTRDAPQANSPANMELQGQLSALDTDVDPVLNDMVSMLDSGDVITGLGAEQRLTAARIAAAAGNETARRQVAATERYLNMAGRLRVGMAKSLGANPSNADLVVLQAVTAGDLGQSAQGLRATLRDGQALSQRQRAALGSRIPSPQSGRQPAAPSRPLSPQEAAALPPGTRFIGTDGVERVRQ